MPVFLRVAGATGFLLAMTAEALAYGGPGAAITLIGSLIGVGLAVFASLFYVVAWPLRRMLKKRKTTASAPGDGAVESPDEEAAARTAAAAVPAAETAGAKSGAGGASSGAS